MTWQLPHARVVADTGGPSRREVEVNYKDIYPPPPVTCSSACPSPASSAALGRVDRARGVRTRSSAARVRAAGCTSTDRPPRRRVRRQPPPSGEVEYAVKAVDAAGNESEALYCKVGSGREVRKAARRRQRLSRCSTALRPDPRGDPAGAGLASLPPAPRRRRRRRPAPARRRRQGRARCVYWNADGSQAAFCANGTRCAARFAAERWGWQGWCWRPATPRSRRQWAASG